MERAATHRETEATPVPAASSRRGPRGPYRNGRRTREQIIAASMAAFSQRGYNGASARQIAAAVGIAPAAITRHFDSKDELLSAVLESWEEQTRAVQGDVADDGLRHWEAQRQVMEYHVANPGLLRLFIVLAAEATDLDHPAREFMARRYRRTADAFADSLLTASECGDIDLISRADAACEARSMMAFMDGIELQWLLDPRIDLVAELDGHLSTTFAHLGRRLPAAPDPMTAGA